MFEDEFVKLRTYVRCGCLGVTVKVNTDLFSGVVMECGHFTRDRVSEAYSSESWQHTIS